MPLYHELKRRNVFRVAIAYLALAWVLTEVASTLFPAFGIPDWGFRFVVIVFALGFVPALVISWAYELTPEGLKRETDVVRDASIIHITAKRLDRITIGLILTAAAFILADRLWLSPRLTQQIATSAEVETDNLQTTGPELTELQYPPNSIAVLPFVNMSDDAANEYFSDGISEELLNLLAKIPKLRVISRSSAFSFKGKDFDIPTVAAQLNVAHVLEGSVRKAGNQVRITVQLIDTRSDTHLWSGTYDRTLDDIFAIQDEIAGAVVDALKLTLLGEAPKVERVNPEAYALYLQAVYLGSRYTAKGYEYSNSLYQQALEIDPSYAAAWGGLAVNYLNQESYAMRPHGEGKRLAREAANQALALDPKNAEAHASLFWIEVFSSLNLEAAAQHLKRALALEPANPNILFTATSLAYSLGRLDEAIVVGEYMIERDPVNPEGYYYLGVSYLWAKRLDEAIASFHTALTLSPGYIMAHYRIGVALLIKGEPEAALAEMQQEQKVVKHLEGKAIAYHALRQQVESDAALAELIDKYERDAAYNIAYVLAFRGEADRAFAWLDKAVQNNDTGLSQIANQPEFTNIHDDPRWLPFLESIGMSPQQLDAIEFKVTLPE